MDEDTAYEQERQKRIDELPEQLTQGALLTSELRREIERRYNGWDGVIQQNRALKEALIGWRQKAWPGIDQRAVVERDFPEQDQ